MPMDTTTRVRQTLEIVESLLDEFPDAPQEFKSHVLWHIGQLRVSFFVLLNATNEQMILEMESNNNDV